MWPYSFQVGRFSIVMHSECVHSVFWLVFALFSLYFLLLTAEQQDAYFSLVYAFSVAFCAFFLCSGSECIQPFCRSVSITFWRSWVGDSIAFFDSFSTYFSTFSTFSVFGFCLFHFAIRFSGEIWVQALRFCCKYDHILGFILGFNHFKHQICLVWFLSFCLVNFIKPVG